MYASSTGTGNSAEEDFLLGRKQIINPIRPAIATSENPTSELNFFLPDHDLDSKTREDPLLKIKKKHICKPRSNISMPKKH